MSDWKLRSCTSEITRTTASAYACGKPADFSLATSSRVSKVTVVMVLTPAFSLTPSLPRPDSPPETSANMVNPGIDQCRHCYRLALPAGIQPLDNATPVLRRLILTDFPLAD